LNKRENCEDCYRLPTISDFKNFKPIIKNENYSLSYYRNDEKEFIPDTNYYWAEDWTFAPGGMVLGNLNIGTYTVDYIFDILFNPLNWRSYIYPISPTTLRFTGNYWEENHLRLSRGATWAFQWIAFFPTPFLIPYSRNPLGMMGNRPGGDFIAKVRLIREVD
jgi:hypothetical protein